STSNVGTYGITQGTLAASANYALTYTGANVVVTARPLTVTADGQSMVYGDSLPTLTFVVGGSGLVNGDSLSGALATTASSTSNVGTYGITQGTLAASANYALTYTGANVAVTARPLTVTANAQIMVYGNSLPTLTYVVGGSGLVNGDSLAGALATTASSTSNVGTYGITQGTLANSNYTITSYIGANVAVTARPLTVTANGQSMVYGNVVPTLTYGVGGSGLVNGDSLTGALATTASATANVGSYGITRGTLAASGNYTLTYIGATVAVTARPLTVTADDQSRAFGAANPVLTWSVSSGNLVNGDSLTGVLSTSADATSPAGTYAIQQNTLAASGNYRLTYVGGVLTVAPAPGGGNTAGGGTAATPAQVAQTVIVSSLPTLLVPQPPTDQWVQTSQIVVLIQESGSDTGTASSSTSTSASGSGCSGSSFSSACERSPHPDNQNYGRWLTFQVQSALAQSGAVR
ncbi:MBG domain-containing protein, partial [Azorhizobium sp. AG788]|uniref:MBG domain-containing protein n=1 Tax=Azorhizobium sp. AG788 TaxID=2183897 RepID=UPI0031399566